MPDTLVKRRFAPRAAPRGRSVPQLAPAAPAPPGRKGLAHRDDIQGLRAVAVLLVVFGHSGVNYVGGGFVGVDVFFVLSGFLITGLLLGEARAHGRVSLVDFYVRRARRILPAAALTLVATDVAAALCLNFVRAQDAVIDSLHAAAFAANFQFAARGTDYFAQTAPSSPILHYWSLSVEEQFYVVWPLLLSLTLFGAAALWRRGPGVRHDRRLLEVVVVLASASLAWSIYLTATHPAAAYFSPFTRAWELGLGATLAVYSSALVRLPSRVRLALGWVGIALIAWSAFAYSERTPFPGSFALVPTVGTAFAIVAGMGEHAPRLAAQRLLALRPMRIVGDRSYAYYLWHWPFLIIGAAYAGHALSVEVKLGLMAAAFGLSCVSYALVENPIRRRIRSRAVTLGVVAVSTAAVLGTATVSLAAIHRERQRFEGAVAVAAPVAPVAVGSRGALPAVIAAVRAARRGAPIPTPLAPPISRIKDIPRAYRPPNQCIAHDSSTKVPSGVCRLGDASSRRTIVLLGDSHAMMWFPSIIELPRHDHWAVIPLLRLGCTPGIWVTHRGPNACREWYRWAVSQVKRLHPNITLLAGSIDDRPTDSARYATEGVIQATRDLQPLGTLVVIGDPEALAFEPVDCLLSPHASMATCTTTWPPVSLAAYDAVERNAHALHVGFLATRGFVCFERECPAVVGHTIVWMDNNHLTALYAVQVAPAFRAALLRVVPRSALGSP